jgi:hypothetical protein
MYFPYLRGKQFELLALRQLAPFLSENSHKIFPIIEPVKESSTLRNLLIELEDRGVNYTFIANPSVGDFAKKKDLGWDFFSSVLEARRNYQLGFLIETGTEHILAQLLSQLAFLDALNPRGLMFIHNEATVQARAIEDMFAGRWKVLYNVINFKRTNRRYYRHFPENTRVSLDDYFMCQDRNVDYLEQDESQFSEEHLYYRGDGFVGFSDFLTIGDNYAEGGFLPYAIAIHLSYADKDRCIRVKHFVSNTNDDTTDIAGKFAEANQKLVEWCDRASINTMAVGEFRKLHATSHFPGLGTLKKLQIMNHIELVATLI